MADVAMWTLYTERPAWKELLAATQGINIFTV